MNDNKKAIIFTFSGTGNTYKASKLFKDEFEKNGVSTDIVNITINTLPPLSVDEYDFVGIAYPIHAFNAPQIVVDFCKKMPKTAGKNLFVLKTSGEPLQLNNISSLKIQRILKKKGYQITNEYHYAMPYNIIFRHNNYMAYKMYDTIKKLAPIDCREILNNQNHLLKKIPFGRFVAFVFRIEHWTMKLNGKHFKVDYDKCIMCQKCVKGCPVNNIKIVDGKFEFGKDCACCMKCSFNCPTDAFSIGMLNNWRVNGQYNFNDDKAVDDGRHSWYCKRAYKRYFDNARDKIASNKLDY